MSNTQRPIYIHSLFRAGSTYIFTAFRRSESGYWCYQEPLNEFLLFARSNPESIIDVHVDKAKQLRHPSMDKPYFYEFYPAAGKVLPLFKKSFPYDQYFEQDAVALQDLHAYITALVENAQGRPVLQCCRSVGRMATAKSVADGVNIFLWRNPWDQWYSYKIDSYFDVANLLIANAQNTPPFITAVKQAIGIEEYHNPEQLDDEILHFQKCRLDARGSYLLFYALWCHALLEAREHCDMDINIDRLSLSQNYRKSIQKRFASYNIDGIDFDDCHVPQAAYGDIDSLFFDEIEQSVHEIMKSNGYSDEHIQYILDARSKHKPAPDRVKPKDQLRDAMNARALARRYESELDGLQRILNTKDSLQELMATQKKLNAKLQELEDLREWTKDLEGQLKAIHKSIFWRLLMPIRVLMRISRRIKNYLGSLHDNKNG